MQAILDRPMAAYPGCECAWWRGLPGGGGDQVDDLGALLLVLAGDGAAQPGNLRRAGELTQSGTSATLMVRVVCCPRLELVCR